MEASARECGYLKSLPPFLDEAEAGFLPDDEILLICTGSQGEPRSAMAKIAEDKHPAIALGEGDTVIFSSRQIPGNEVAIQRVQDGLVRRGCRLITDEQAMVHVSGHPAREELRRLYALVKPRIAVPVHGEWRHMQEHADLARATGAKPVLLNDGDVLRLSGNRAEVIEAVPTGRLAVDGDRLLPLDGDVIAARRRMMFNGVVLASVALDRQGKVLGEYAVKQLAGKRIAIIDDRTAYGQGLADEFEKAAKAAGGNIVGREYTNDKATDFRAILTTLRGKKPDLIFYGLLRTWLATSRSGTKIRTSACNV
jgi:mRNA degradation ribonuclease J1/J2